MSLGHYSWDGHLRPADQGLASCVPCPFLGQVTASWGSTSVSQCICDVGYIGTGGLQACQQCPSSSTTSAQNLLHCDICAVGYYNPSDGSPPCRSCPEGFTTLGTRSTACVNATLLPPSPTKAPTLSSQPMISAAPSKRPSRSPVKTKVPTRLPTFQPSQYDDCEVGTFSMTGKVNASVSHCDACPAGSTNENAGSMACDKCLEGYWKDTSSRPYVCTICPGEWGLFPFKSLP